MLFTPTQIKPKLFESTRNSFFFFLPRVDVLLFTCMPGRYVTSIVLSEYQYPNLSESADCVGGQLCGDKKCPFSGVTKSGRVWRKVLESDTRSVRSPIHPMTLLDC